jgi:DNA replication protein DnaC
LLITSNKAFGQWGQVFGDDMLAAAILDRVLHHSSTLCTPEVQFARREGEAAFCYADQPLVRSTDGR